LFCGRQNLGNFVFPAFRHSVDDVEVAAGALAGYSHVRPFDDLQGSDVGSADFVAFVVDL
jgi:hypothetical protein